MALGGIQTPVGSTHGKVPLSSLSENSITPDLLQNISSETISCIENTEVGWSSMLGQGVPTPTHFMSAQRESEVPLEVWWLGWLQSYLFTTDNKKAPSPEPGIHCPSPGFSPFSGSPCQLGLVHQANLGSSAMKCKTPFYNPCGQMRASDRRLKK